VHLHRQHVRGGSAVGCGVAQAPPVAALLWCNSSKLQTSKWTGGNKVNKLVAHLDERVGLPALLLQHLQPQS
jgi:hypothetical protein